TGALKGRRRPASQPSEPTRRFSSRIAIDEGGLGSVTPERSKHASVKRTGMPASKQGLPRRAERSDNKEESPSLGVACKIRFAWSRPALPTPDRYPRSPRSNRASMRGTVLLDAAPRDA